MENAFDEHAPEAPPRPPGNGMGVAGFVVSLVGFVLTCGLLCPIGLIFSLIGLGRQPKGFAIAGTIIGALGSLMLVAVAVFGWPYGVTGLRLAWNKNAIETYAQEHGEMPDDEEGVRILPDPLDGWDRPFRYVRIPGSYELKSAGPDGLFDTQDDLELGNATRRP